MKNKFIKSTILLIIGGIITKILAMVLKIFLTRIIGNKGIGLYMLIMPTFTLFITISTMSLPTSISKVISEGKSSKKVILSLLPITIIYNIFIMLFLYLLSPLIANNLLKNPDTILPIKAICFTLPFIAISSILKGYFYGKVRMLPYVISNVTEQIVRLTIIIIFIPKLISYGINIAVFGVVIVNIISEFISIIILLLFIPNKHIDISFLKPDKIILKDILNISLNTTGSRFIGSISYFLEPIILTFILLKCGYSTAYITNEYGIITGYVFPLLLLPSFFSSAISTTILPILSKSIANNNLVYTKKKLTEAIILSLIIGLFFTILFILFPEIILKLIYNTDKGVNYIRIISPLFLLLYIQTPLTSYMQAANMANKAMKGTFYSAIIKNIVLLITPIFIGIWGLIIANITNIFIVTIHHIYYVKKSLKTESKISVNLIE